MFAEVLFLGLFLLWMGLFGAQVRGWQKARLAIAAEALAAQLPVAEPPPAPTPRARFKLHVAKV